MGSQRKAKGRGHLSSPGKLKLIINSRPVYIKEVLNSNFRPFSLELKKIRFFKINFDLGFRVL